MPLVSVFRRAIKDVVNPWALSNPTEPQTKWESSKGLV